MNSTRLSILFTSLLALAACQPAQAFFWGKRMEGATQGARKGSPLDKFLSAHPTGMKRQRQIQKRLPKVRARNGRK